MAACAAQAQTNNAHDNCHTCAAQATMCRVKKYLGVEIGIASGSASRAVTAFFFNENDIIYKNK
jgi:hypothetical protein